MSTLSSKIAFCFTLQTFNTFIWHMKIFFYFITGISKHVIWCCDRTSLASTTGLYSWSYIISTASFILWTWAIWGWTIKSTCDRYSSTTTIQIHYIMFANLSCWMVVCWKWMSVNKTLFFFYFKQNAHAKNEGYLIETTLWILSL